MESGPVSRQLERGGRVPRAREGTADNAKGRERRKEENERWKEQGPRVRVRTRADKGETGGGCGRTLWI